MNCAFQSAQLAESSRSAVFAGLHTIWRTMRMGCSRIWRPSWRPQSTALRWPSSASSSSKYCPDLQARRVPPGSHSCQQSCSTMQRVR